MRNEIYEKTGKLDAEKSDLIRSKDICLSKIDKRWNTEDLVAKGLKEIKKTFERNSGTRKEEEAYIRNEKKLKASIEYIVKKE